MGCGQSQRVSHNCTGTENANIVDEKWETSDGDERCVKLVRQSANKSTQNCLANYGRQHSYSERPLSVVHVRLLATGEAASDQATIRLGTVGEKK